MRTYFIITGCKIAYIEHMKYDIFLNYTNNSCIHLTQY